MTTEEKAKAYDEALERFRAFKEKYYTKDTNLGDVIFDKTGEMQKDFEEIFPELRESEDEKMMNQLHSWMKEFGGAEEYTERVFQWLKGLLEKQKEQKELPLMDGNADLYFDEWNQQKQNPTKRQCFEEGMRYAQRLQKEQKPVDDKAFEEWIDDYWKHNKVNNPDSYDKGDEIQFDERGFKNFCRGIRNMYQQNHAEWSEEDVPSREMILAIWELGNEWKEKPVQEISQSQLKFIQNHWKESSYFDKIKSPCHKPHWKPSEEQMRALNEIICLGEISYVGQEEELIALRNKLKKLM